MFSLYNVLKFGHVVAVVAWVGGGVLMQTLAARARRASPEKLVDFAKDAAWLGNRYFMPASILTLAFGIALVVTGHLSLKPLWIKLGLLGFLLTAVNGAANLGRISKRLAKLGDERGPNDPAVQFTARRLLTMMNVDLVVVLAVIFDMVIKPT